MSKILVLRALSPALLDYTALTYTPLGVKGQRYFSRTVQRKSSDNKDYEINPEFINRNPRNLERLGLQPKRKGWKFQAPRKNYYNILIFEASKHHITGRVEHWTGTTVVEASTKDWSLAKHLYSTSDVSAAENVGKMLARRCLEAGIHNIFCDRVELEEKSERLQVILKALEDANIDLTEVEEVEHEERPGIDYDNLSRYNPKRKWTDDIQPL